MRKFVAGSALALVIGGIGGTAFAGESTGGPNPKPTPGGDKARSVCSFSGQEDGLALIGFTPQGAPIFLVVPTGPGLVQTPHMENAAGIIHAPGAAGQACRGNGG